MYVSIYSKTNVSEHFKQSISQSKIFQNTPNKIHKLQSTNKSNLDNFKLFFKFSFIIPVISILT